MLTSVFTKMSQVSANERIESVLLLDPEHLLFKGHFPDKPILPGVVLIDLFKKEAETYSKQNLQITTLKNVKFKDIIEVKTSAELRLVSTIKRKENKLQLLGKAYLQEEHLVAQLNLNFTEL